MIFPQIWPGLEPRCDFKIVYSCQFLSKSHGRNVRKSFTSFKIDVSARIFEKRRQENQKSLRKSAIFGEILKNPDFEQKSLIFSEFSGFSSSVFQKSEPTRRFQMSQKSFCRFSQVIWTKNDSCGHFWSCIGVRIRLFTVGFEPVPSYYYHSSSSSSTSKLKVRTAKTTPNCSFHRRPHLCDPFT